MKHLIYLFFFLTFSINLFAVCNNGPENGCSMANSWVTCKTTYIYNPDSSEGYTFKQSLTKFELDLYFNYTSDKPKLIFSTLRTETFADLVDNGDDNGPYTELVKFGIKEEDINLSKSSEKISGKFYYFFNDGEMYYIVQDFFAGTDGNGSAESIDFDIDLKGQDISGELTLKVITKDDNVFTTVKLPLVCTFYHD